MNRIEELLIAKATIVDFKEELETAKPKSWLKSVSAFANGIGGSLLYGIKDVTRELTGTFISVASNLFSPIFKL